MSRTTDDLKMIAFRCPDVPAVTMYATYDAITLGLSFAIEEGNLDIFDKDYESWQAAYQWKLDRRYKTFNTWDECSDYLRRIGIAIDAA